jgi:hypothetical protein
VQQNIPSEMTNILRPQANYTGRSTATVRQILVPAFVDRGVSCGQFSRQEPLLFFQVALHFRPRGRVDSVPDPLLLRKSGSAGIRTRDLSADRNSDHETGRPVEYLFNSSRNSQPLQNTEVHIYIYIYIYNLMGPDVGEYVRSYTGETDNTSSCAVQ